MNGMTYPPRVNIKEPKSGPARKPIPVNASINPMFISLSCFAEFLTNKAMLATEFMPEPMPPMN